MGEYYVYAYPYPEEMGGSIFYVGKGLGNRMYRHLTNARQSIDTSCSIKIREIWEMGYETHPQILYQDVSEKDALILEKRFIRRYARLGELVNETGFYAGNDLTSWERLGIDNHLDTFLIGSVFDPLLYPERLQRALEKIPNFALFMPKYPNAGSLEDPVGRTITSVLKYMQSGEIPIYEPQSPRVKCNFGIRLEPLSQRNQHTSEGECA